VPHPHADLVAGLYAALARGDGPGMAACYGPDASFEDPVFRLHGPPVGAMWRMLCERATDLRVAARDIAADGATGSAHVEAWYAFGPARRPVHNIIEARFTFGGGRILEHRDRFDFHRWAGQAFGLAGRLLGWAPPFHALVRRRSATTLEQYIARRGLGIAGEA
jgi:hypothetical protein